MCVFKRVAAVFRENRAVNAIAKIAVGLVLLILLARSVDYTEALRAFGILSVGDITVVLLICSVSALLAVLGWKVLVWDYSFTKLMGTIMIGHFYTLVLPGQLFGEAAKIVYLAKGKEKGEAERVSVSIIVNKLTSLLGLLLIGVTGILIDRNVTELWFIGLGLILLFVLLTAALFLIRFDIVWILVLKANGYFERFAKLKKLLSFGMRLLNAWRGFASKTWAVLVSILVGVFFQLTLVLAILYVCYVFKIGIPFHSLCWIQTVMSLVALLPITIGGIGVREAGYAGLFAMLGYSTTEGVSVSLVMFAVTIAYAVAGGIVVLKNLFVKRKVTS